MNVAFIPVRGGSKSIPLKNIKPICGKPLVYWTIKAACGCAAIDRVYVATDSDAIRKTVEGFKADRDPASFTKVEVIGRSAETASDTASTESAMLEFATDYDFDNIVLIQATSPLLKSEDLDAGFAAFELTGTDSVLSAVRQKRFNWKIGDAGVAAATNYNPASRPRRQDFEGYFVENGAFYITSRERLLKTGIRISGKIRIAEMCEDSFLEIDEPSDWVIIEALMRKNGSCAETSIPEIKLLLTDCDGCLTDAGMYYSEKGDELKKFNTRDGMGFALLHRRGIPCGMVTGEDVELNRRRSEKLKLEFYVPGCKDKLTTIQDICKRMNIGLENVCYIGDDLNDLDVLKAVGYGCCPSDANPVIRAVAKFVTTAKGGEGVIREVVDVLFNSRVS